MNDREQRIRTRAYEIWEREGRRNGQAEEHWRQAEAEIEGDLGQPGTPAVTPEQPPKKAGQRAASSAAKTTMMIAEASKSKKPPKSHSQKAAGDAKPSAVTKKPAASRSRRTPPV